ncbi:MAG: RagB/SusD family nutrient uptake outer membrane protein [Chitinophagaceae bacterium]|nr:MAG: RagB/SusD family nutrient uptake outer membrane protein [Chitinophagaceae bacterium]
MEDCYWYQEPVQQSDADCKNSNISVTYNRRETVKRHNFLSEMYLPIPNVEINKMPAMVQNPGL